MENVCKYEAIFIVNPELNEEEAKGLLGKFSDIIVNNGGSIEKVDEWGKKKLAYLIDDYSEGYYYVVEFASAAEIPAELDRVFNITDGILRSLIIRREQ